jgi:very-short-patch-repair endonuclease
VREGRFMTNEPRQFARSLRKASTSAEDVLWQALRGRRFQGLKFRRQVPFLSYTVDFLCVERRLVVELDGKQHDWYAEYDARRTEEIERHGFALIWVMNGDVMNDLDSVLMSIAKAVVPTAPAFPHPWPLSHTGEGNGG